VSDSNPRIVFFGTPEFAVASLQAIVDAGFDVAGVVTMPDKPAGRGHKLYTSPVKDFAVAHNLHLMQPPKLKAPEFVDELRSINADLFVVIAFRMLPEIVWSMPRLGTFNLHASLLPKYRGAAPINHAIINGDTVTGITTFFLKHEIDTGDIIDRVSVDINPDDNAGSLHDKLMALGARLTVKTIRSIIDGSLTTTPQSALTGDQPPTPAPKIFRDTCHIDWSKPAVRIHNLVRGLSPYPAAWTTIHSDGAADVDIKVFTTAVPCPDAPDDILTGEIAINGDRMFVGAADGAVEILELQPTGKKRMHTADYLRGARLNNPHIV